MQRIKRRLEQGDTLVEVMLAVAILSLVTVLTMALVNREHARALSSINRASVRSEINSQVELLWYFHDMGIRVEDSNEGKVWEEIKNNKTIALSAEQKDECTYGANSFYLDTSYITPVVGAIADVVKTPAGFVANGDALYNENSWQVKPGRGIWIDADLNSSGGGLEYIDFYVKACWTSIGGSKELSSTVVRMNLYE